MRRLSRSFNFAWPSDISFCQQSASLLEKKAKGDRYSLNFIFEAIAEKHSRRPNKLHRRIKAKTVCGKNSLILSFVKLYLEEPLYLSLNRNTLLYNFWTFYDVKFKKSVILLLFHLNWHFSSGPFRSGIMQSLLYIVCWDFKKNLFQ